MSDLFSTSRLANEAGLRTALYHLDTILTSRGGLQAAVEHLLTLPHVFAYIVSGISQTFFPAMLLTDSLTVWDRCQEMITQIMIDFPTDAQEYLSSLSSKMLDILSTDILTLPIESLARDVSRDISRHRVFIEGATPVLCALSTMKFADSRLLEDNVRMKAPRAVRKGNRQKAPATVDTSNFIKLGVVVPPTSEAASLLSTYILSELNQILSVCMLHTFQCFP